MIDLYLRAETEDIMMAEFATVASFLVGENKNKEIIWKMAGHGWCFDPIGSIILTPGEYDENGNELVAPIFDTRFHANLRLWGEYENMNTNFSKIEIVNPETPVRIWV